jgi:hypothetical protein
VNLLDDEDDVLDRVEGDEISNEPDRAWYKQALRALADFTSQSGGHRFTSPEFRRWATYYYDLNDPSSRMAYSWLFRTANKRGLIKAAGKCKSYGRTDQNMWVAA